MAKFGFSENDCDVHDREKLARYRALASRWFEWLDDDDEHAIGRQISQLMWHDAVFRALNDARRLEGAEKTSSRAPTLAQFIDQGYVSGQVLGISKLVEYSNPKQPTKGVISLKRIVDEMSANRDLFTREIFVAHDGLPYDGAAAEAAFLEKVATSGFEAMDTEGPLAWDSAARLHELFDRISGVKPGTRQRDDRLPDEVFDRLVAALDDPVFGDIRLLRHKSLAHAADAASRLQAPPRKGLTMSMVASAHRILLGVQQAVSAGLLYGSWRGAAIPVAQHDIFALFEEPFIPPGQEATLRASWDANAAERDEWLKDAYAEFIPL